MDRYEGGMKIRRDVLGDEHVDRALEKATETDADFQRFITEVAWGAVWARPGLDRRSRSLVTIAILGALGREELDLHLKAAKRTGATLEEIKEVLLHVAVYAGVPAANRAMERLKKIYDEDTSGAGGERAR